MADPDDEPPMAPPVVLIVEDDEDIASALSRGLMREGYAPRVADSVEDGARRAAEGCDAMIVDRMLGEARGEDLVRRLRAEGFEVPIIMLSALSDVESRAEGLAAGADDYVAKPFEFAELMARLKVQERRRAAALVRPFTYDPERREAIRGDRRAHLTEREGALLALLLSREGDVLSRGEIFDTLWLSDGGSSENVVDVYLGYLRRKLAPMSDFGIEIRTVRGRGFMLRETGDD